DLPLTLKGKDVPALMAVRGEVYLPWVGFRRLNERRAGEGETPFASPRTAAAGALRPLDPAITRARRLRLFAFSVEVLEGSLSIASHTELLAALERWGFVVEPHHRRVDSLAEARDAVPEYEAMLRSLPFQADGMVLKVDAIPLHEEL